MIVIAGQLSCLDDPSGPVEFGAGQLSLQPLLPTAVGSAAFAIPITSFRVRARSQTTAKIVLDTVVAFDTDSAEVSFRGRIPMVTQAEDFLVILDLLGDVGTLYRGERRLLLQQGLNRAPRLDTIPVQYVGPGGDIAAIAVVPGDTVLTFDDAIRYGIVAIDSAGEPIDQFYISWSVTDATLASVNGSGRLRAPALRGQLLVRAMTPSGITDSVPVTFIPLPSRLSVVQGDGDTSTVGTEVELAVRVIADDDMGIRGIPVWFVAGPGGSVPDAVVVSDSTGLATTTASLGRVAGNYGFTARVSDELHDVALEVALLVAATAGRPATMRIEQGDEQAGRVDEYLDLPIRVQVLDPDSNPVAGQLVNFIVTSGGGEVFGGMNTTNEEGLATERWKLGTSTAEDHRLEARWVDNETGDPVLFAVFTAQPLPGLPVLLEKHSGDEQPGVVATPLDRPLAVVITDEFGNPVPDAEVEWSTTAGTIVGLGPSDAEGVAAATWVLGTVTGSQAASVTLDGVTVLDFAAEAAAGAPRSLVVTNGSNQTALVGSTLPELLEVSVVDEFGNPVSGAAVNWAVTAGEGVLEFADVLTGPDGIATAQWTLGTSAGSQVVSVALDGNGALSGEFEAEGKPGAAATLVFIGQPPDGKAGVLLAPAISIAVNDEFGNLVGVELTVELSAISGEGDVPLLGTTVVQAEGGIATFADLSIELAGGDFRLRAIVMDLSSISDAFDIGHGSVSSLAVAADDVLLTALGATTAVTASLADPFGNDIVDVSLEWTSSATTVATVDSEGIVTAAANGVATISTVVDDSVTGFVDIVVSQVATSVIVNSPTAVLTALDETQQLEADPVDANGHLVPNVVITWNSSDITVVTVDQGGIVTAVGEGDATVTADAEGAALGSADLVVEQVPTSASVQPAQTTLTAVGESVQLTVHATDANGHDVAEPEILWLSSDTTIATVDDSGLVTAVGEGEVTITAGFLDGTTSEITLTIVINVVVDPVLAGVLVTPDTVTLTALGATQNLSATPVDANNNPLDAGPVAWSSSDEAIATVDLDGFVTAISNGVVTVTATIDGVAGSATVEVEQLAVTLSVTPTQVSFTALGESVQLMVDARDARGNVITDPDLTWSSSAEGVATVSDAGLITAVGAGEAVVTARAGDASATVTVVVELDESEPLQIVIDVKPGSDVATINLNLNGSIPVAVLTTIEDSGDPVTFDVQDLDIATVRLAGATVDHRSFADLDEDGDVDLILHFRRADLALAPDATEIELTGETHDGMMVKGANPVVVVPKKTNQ